MGRYAVVGRGNLAWHLAQVLPGEVVVVSRQPGQEDWPAPVLPYAALADQSVDAVFVAVPDNVIAEVSRQLAALLPPTLRVLHTSGATPLGQLDSYFRHRGVLWPIRSLRRGEAVGTWRDLPLVTFASDAVTRDWLTSLANSLSDTVAYLDDRQRAQLHLAAVFSNNFVTALYEVAYQLCSAHAVPFELLLPIIRHTAAQQDGQPPRDRQTGAAARGDTATMHRHLQLLTDPRYRQLYRDLSQLILEYRLSQHHPHLRRDADDDL